MPPLIGMVQAQDEREHLFHIAAEPQPSASSSSPASRKRKRSSLSTSEDSSSEETGTSHDDKRVKTTSDSKKKSTPQIMTKVRLPALIYPRSFYQENNQPAATFSETDILKSAVAHFRTLGSPEREDFNALDLDEFCIYRPHAFRKIAKRHVIEEAMMANEMVSLHEIDGKSSNLWFFDGLVCHGETKTYVERVPCSILSIGAFEDTSLHTVGSAIWIQSHLGQESDVWYCLRNPSLEYERFHRPFLWVADLVKHLVDYLHNHNRVNLSRLQEHFHGWLQLAHGADETFQRWVKTYSDTDFRRIVAAHARFLYNQAAQLGENYALHPLWLEVDPLAMDAVPRQSDEVKSSDKIGGQSESKSKTIVTPFVYECFKHLPWAKYLEVQNPSSSLRTKRLQKEGASIGNLQSQVASQAKDEQSTDSDIEEQATVHIGEVVAVRSDSETDWKSNDSSLWYGYVQGVTTSKLGVKLNLIWLYKSSDTPCQSMRYPYSNELFLSDHCNCGDRSIYDHEIVSKPKVAFFGDPHSLGADFFVRQKYNGVDSAWVTLNSSDFECACTKPPKLQTYSAGTTLLVNTAAVTSKPGQTLEPVELLRYAPNDQIHKIQVRRLIRRISFGDRESQPNELVYTSRIDIIPVSRIVRSCHVRFYTVEEREAGEIPVPYCRGGTGDFYYIISQEHSTSNFESHLAPLTRPWPRSLLQGFDPTTPAHSPMRGLDIFCGGGSLGRGVEEGGAVQMEWAVDYFKQAIHTYRANLQDADQTKLYYGSVNNYLSQAMKGKQGKLVARFGEVHVILAGSPCQGFSQANLSKGSEESLINVSMVASVVSFVDFYRPKYAILENVLGMAKCASKDKEKNVFAQVLCALVAMGYQVRPYILDAWNFGSPQSRTRVFISVTAPGLMPLPDPPQSHSHPEGINDRSLGKTANGLPLGERYWAPTPFRYRTIKECTNDLPLNEDGRVDCIPFPDHRCSRILSSINQIRISRIPKHPHGTAFVKAVNMDWMPKMLIDSWSWDQHFRSTERSRAWKRILPDALLPTVTTRCVPEDGISGQWLHWDADRPITVMEARRAQGFPDHEVIVGAPVMQWKIIGNSVARPVALALGVALRTAWLANSNHRAEASAKLFAQDLEAARNAAFLPAKAAKESSSDDEIAIAPKTVRSAQLFAGVQVPIASTVSKSLRSPISEIMDMPRQTSPQFNNQDPVIISSDSEHSQSGEAAVFTPPPIIHSTRETTTSEISTIKTSESIRVEARSALVSAQGDWTPIDALLKRKIG